MPIWKTWFFDKLTLSVEKPSFSINWVFHMINWVYWEKLSFFTEKLRLSINLDFTFEKPSFFRLKNLVVLYKLSVLVEKPSFLIENRVYRSKNWVYQIIAHLACHKQGINLQCMFSSNVLVFFPQVTTMLISMFVRLLCVCPMWNSLHLVQVPILKTKTKSVDILLKLWSTANL